MERTFSSPVAAPDYALAIPALRRLVARLRRAAARRASLRALARLDPHLLADIGVTPHDAHRALRKSGLTPWA